MIARTIVQCPGCSSRITLRFSVGPADTHPFYYVCESCNAATRGTFDASNPPALPLTLEDGQQLFEEVETKQVTTIDTTIPVVPHTRDMSAPGGSPFLFIVGALGKERLSLLREGQRAFPNVVRVNRRSLARLFQYYLDRNWDAFDAGLAALWPKDNPPHVAWHRHDLMHRLLDLMTVSVWGADGGAYPTLKTEWNTTLQPTPPIQALLAHYLPQMDADPYVVEVQRKLFDCFRLYADNHAAWLPGYAITLLPNPRLTYGDLRVYRDDFPALRDLYVSAFETCHSALDILMPLLNIAVRHDATHFDRPKRVRKPASNLKQFRKLRAVDKAEYLSDLPQWYSMWTVLLDRDLRNAIGHADIRHDLASGNLVSSEGVVISYADFLSKVHQLVHPLLAAMNAIKLPLVYAGMISATAVGSPKSPA